MNITVLVEMQEEKEGVERLIRHKWQIEGAQIEGGRFLSTVEAQEYRIYLVEWNWEMKFLCFIHFNIEKFNASLSGKLRGWWK